MDDKTFGRILRRMRNDAGKTVPEVSKHLTSLGYRAATQTIYGWERGLSQPNPDPFLEMCRFYGITDILSYFGDVPIGVKKGSNAAEVEPGNLFASIEQQYGNYTRSAFSMYLQLDQDDQGEIRGEMKQMLKADKYKSVPCSKGESVKVG